MKIEVTIPPPTKNLRKMSEMSLGDYGLFEGQLVYMGPYHVCTSLKDPNRYWSNGCSGLVELLPPGTKVELTL